MASFFQISRGNGYAIGDCSPGDRDCEPLDATWCLLGQDRDAFLDSCVICLPFYGLGVHTLCSCWYVC